MSVYFVESSAFTRRIVQLGLEPELRSLQEFLAVSPTAGRTDAGTGGLRKVRLPDARRHKGKRSGARIHYLYMSAHDVIYLLFVYAKDEQLSLTRQQKRQLAALADQIRSEWAR